MNTRRMGRPTPTILLIDIQPEKRYPVRLTCYLGGGEIRVVDVMGIPAAIERAGKTVRDGSINHVILDCPRELFDEIAAALRQVGVRRALNGWI